MTAKLMLASLLVLSIRATAQAERVCYDAYAANAIEQLRAGLPVPSQRTELTEDIARAAMDSKAVVLLYLDHRFKFKEGTIQSVDPKSVTLGTLDGPITFPLNEGLAELRRSEAATDYTARVEALKAAVASERQPFIETAESALASGATVLVRKEIKVPRGIRVLTFTGRIVALHSYRGVEPMRPVAPTLSIRVATEKIVEEVFVNGQSIAVNESAKTSAGFKVLTNEFPNAFDVNPEDPSITAIDLAR